MNIEIRPITGTALSALDLKVRAAYGRTHADELRDQEQGLLTFYIVWSEERPIGTCFINWTGPRDVDVRLAYPECPEIYRLHVFKEFQSQGIGTKLIRVCEDAARDRGFGQIGLGVALENRRAYALYRRLGYAVSLITNYMDVYQYEAADGLVQIAQDPLRYLIKDLRDCS